MKVRLLLMSLCLSLALAGCGKDQAAPAPSSPEGNGEESAAALEDRSVPLAFTPAFDGKAEGSAWGVSLGDRCYFAQSGDGSVTVEAVDMETGKCTQRESFDLGGGGYRMRGGPSGVALWSETRIVTLDSRLSVTGEMDMPWCVDAPIDRIDLSEDFTEVVYLSGDGVYLTPAAGSAPTLIISQPFVADPEDDGVFTSVRFCDNGSKLCITKESETVRNRVLIVDRLNNLASGNILKSMETYAWHRTCLEAASRYGVCWFLPEQDGVSPTTAVWLLDFTVDGKKELDLEYLSEHGSFSPVMGEYALAYNDGDDLCRLDFSNMAVTVLRQGCGPDARVLAVSESGDVAAAIPGGGETEYCIFAAER